MLTSASFKLQKLNRSMELKSSYSKAESNLLTPIMSATNSVVKSVKYNNIQFITGQEICKLRRQPQQPLENPQFSSAENNMTNIKKRYDQTNHQKMYLQNKIERLNEEKNKLMSLASEFLSNKSCGKNKVAQLEDQLEFMKLKLLDKEFQKMSMVQIRDVIVYDKIVYDKKKYDLEKELHKIIFKNKSIKQLNLHQAEEYDRTLKVYEKLISKINSQKGQRQQHINSIESRVIQKQGIHNSSVLIKSQTISIAETTICERDPQEKEWVNIFLTQKLLKNLLESKIDREMNKFFEVQNAFKNIKIATGVNDAQSLVKKFLSKEQIFGDLLSKITQNQREIQVLRMKKEQYLKEIQKTEKELQEFQAIKTYDEDLREWLKEAEHYDERKNRSELQDMKLKHYLFKQLKILSGEKDEKSKNIKRGATGLQNEKKVRVETNEEVKENFLNHLRHLSSLVDESQKLEIDQNDFKKGDKNALINENAISKVFRVKPYVKAPGVSANDKKISEDYVHPYEQEEITTANDELQAVDEQRVSLLRSNEKFMRQLKRKIQQQKQLMIESLVKNAKEKAAPVPIKKVQTPQQ